MKNHRADEILNNLIDDLTLSSSDARNYLTEHGVDSEGYIQKGLKEIESIKNKKDKQNSGKKTKSEFFKRLSLAGKIADELHLEPTFGRVKFMKMQYLSEQVAEMNLTHLYLKEVAGPFDNKFMFALYKNLEKQRWFKEVSREGRYVYKPLENSEGYKIYYERYFSRFLNEIQWLIETFRKWRTDDVELVATIHYCYADMKKKHTIINDDSLCKHFYEFNKSKKKFSKSEVLSMKGWMKENGVI